VNRTEVLLVDASVWVLLVDPGDPLHRDAVALIRERATSLAALDLTVHEIGNAIGVKRRDAREAINVIRLLLAACRDRVVAADVDLARSALEIAVSADVADLVSKGLAVAPGAADYP
jgi:predicted nucleic acid-binding protein